MCIIYTCMYVYIATLILNEVSHIKWILYDITHRWNLKNNTNEFIYKTETNKQNKTETESQA